MYLYVFNLKQNALSIIIYYSHKYSFTCVCVKTQRIQLNKLNKYIQHIHAHIKSILFQCFYIFNNQYMIRMIAFKFSFTRLNRENHFTLALILAHTQCVCCYELIEYLQTFFCLFVHFFVRNVSILNRPDRKIYVYTHILQCWHYQ